MQEPESEPLFPCPFCGGGISEICPDARIWTGTVYGEPIAWSVRHWCAKKSGPTRIITKGGRTKEEAIARWNESALDKKAKPSLADENKRLRHLIADIRDWDISRYMTIPLHLRVRIETDILPRSEEL